MKKDLKKDKFPKKEECKNNFPKYKFPLEKISLKKTTYLKNSQKKKFTI